MDGLRRVRAGTVALAAAGVMLALAPAAEAQRPPSLGPGAPAGQSGIQLYNFNGYLTNGAGEITCPAPPATPTLYCVGPPAPTTNATRLTRVFAFLQSRGIKHLELYAYPGHPFPSAAAGNTGNVAGQQALRALGDQYGLRFRGRHGNLTEANWDNQIAASRIVGQDHIGEAGFPNSPGSYNTLNGAINTAALLDRLGKRSVEAGLGPAYFHNHQQEFNTRLTDNGVLKYAWEIIMDRTDPRYVSAQIDIGWAVCGLSFGTPPDVATAQAEVTRLITKYGKRIVSFHVKDIVNARPTCGDPDQRELGLGEINFVPMFAAAKNLTKYYLAERDPVAIGGATNFNPFVNTANSALAMKGDPAAVVSALPQSFTPVQAGATGATVGMVVTNDGDADLTVAGITVVPEQGYPQTQDFTVVSTTCTGGPIAPNGTCTVNLAFTPHASLTTSVAYLTFDGNSDDAVERVLLAGRSAADTTAPTATITTPANGAIYALGQVVNAAYACADNDTVASCAGTVANGSPIDTSSPGPKTFTVVARDQAGLETTVSSTYNVAARATGTVGGSVGATLSLTLGAQANFGAIIPGVAATYDASTTANVISTAGDAALTVADPSATATGRLVNGTFSLPQVLTARAGSAAFQPVGGSANPTTLVTYSAPVSNDVQTIGFRQAVASTDALRTGAYSKTLTFTLSTTTP